MASRAQTGNIGYFEGPLEPEVQPRFGGNRDLLAVGPNLHTCTCAAACGRADRGAFAASGDGSNQGAEGSSAADAFRRLLASRLSHSPHIAADDVVRLALERNGGK